MVKKGRYAKSVYFLCLSCFVSGCKIVFSDEKSKVFLGVFGFFFHMDL